MSKNIFKGSELERLHSCCIHKKGIPLLISSKYLRERGCGQIDLAIIQDKVILIYEIKSSFRISRAQKRRLKKSAELLGHIFCLPSKLYLRVGLPKG